MRRVAVLALVLGLLGAGSAQGAVRPALTVAQAKERALAEEPALRVHAARRISSQWVRLRITTVFIEPVAGGTITLIYGPWWIDVWPQGVEWAGCGRGPC